MRASETAEVIFDECFVPDEQVVGGNEKIGTVFSRLCRYWTGKDFDCILSLGIAKGAYEASIKYAKERQQFGHPISDFQAIAFKLADMLPKLRL